MYVTEMSDIEGAGGTSRVRVPGIKAEVWLYEVTWNIENDNEGNVVSWVGSYDGVDLVIFND
jgi:hypothetical protein